MTTKKGWQEMFIDNKLFCNHYFSSKNAMNIIVTHTPLGSTTLMQPAYEPLTKYNVNIFGIDFSGTGQSKGADFSLETIIADMNAVVDYIAENYSDNIHIFGNTGIGGIFAQYAVNSGVDKKIKSFAQFACAVHKDTSALGKPLWLVKMLVPILKTFPNTKMTFKVPKFSGFNADKDNAFYEELEKLVPNSMQCKLSLLSTLLESIVANESVLQNDIACPTLVFKVLHDRYFPPQYFDKYYSALKCEKKLVEINDAHNSYYYNSDLFCEEAYNWFISRCKVPK